MSGSKSEKSWEGKISEGVLVFFEDVITLETSSTVVGRKEESVTLTGEEAGRML